ncbi:MULTISPECIES: hypothetical protein [unclassified Leisingera]|uniref:hypothetical protein n=1 Tax=unclassified Leisingera TaxID=2614906 RepID=UPI0002ED7DC8|nr:MULTISPECIES: hypothetical protein [unclassified Leisingera]KIC14704.1 hypothetical protein RA21_18560 [Leisingera sp. ANG-DT]KIC26112.1 hypothetical protein RA23_04025 [Leisingera sp. ANG-S3]KIC30718.1 hypothetical protein RA24_01695 [Leisingera sp. ANG-M6]KIC31853.1 hypothetical protein RA25_13910 [Leisingera sp. ANG-S5]KIC55095.1 hypothetical protein RA22_03290 [Leisingera sp. ANG-S]
MSQADTDIRDITLAFHVGAPNTDNGQLTWSLRKDAQPLLERGVMIRRPGTYMSALNQLLRKQDQEFVTEQEREALLAGLVKDQAVSRIILTNSSFLGVPGWMLNGGRLYRNAGKNAAALRGLFPGNPCEFFLGLRNPATLVGPVFKSQSGRTWKQFASDTDFLNLRWSEVVEDIQDRNPGCRITVWCNEETPVIWPSILGHVTGLGEGFRFSGELDITRGIISEAGYERLEAYLASRPGLSEDQRERVRALFLSYFHDEAEIEEEIDLPGWSQALVDDMSESYVADAELIRHMPGVTFLS